MDYTEWKFCEICGHACHQRCKCGCYESVVNTDIGVS